MNDDYRTLRGTDLDVGPYILGTMDFGGQVDEDTARQLVDIALDHGITMFDTSNHYVQGRSEEVLGRILAPIRDEVLIATKVGSQGGERPLSAPVIRDEVDRSLQRLKTDRIDLYYLHRPDWNTPIDETLEVLQELVEEGKLRYLAQSNYAAWQIADFVHRAGDAPAPTVSQQCYNLLARRLEEEYEACAEAFDIPTIAYNPLAGGLLTGKHDLEAGPPAGTRFEAKWYRETYFNQPHFDAVAQLKVVAEDAGWTLTDMALRWLKHQPMVDSILVGASKVAHLEQNLVALEGPAPDEDMRAAIDEAWRPLRGAAMAYNR